MDSELYEAVEKLLERRGLLVVGKNVQRLDALDKVLGRPIYTLDALPENALFCKAVRSKVAHGLIKRIDLSEALKLPGVKAVLTAKDVPGINESAALIPDKPLLAEDRVRFYGEAVALVVASDPCTAEEAAELVRVEYEPLPAVFDPLEAMRPDAPKVHTNGNVIKHIKVRKGDVEVGFREADLIVENTFKTPFQYPCPLEPEVGFAIPEEDGSVTCVGSLQSPFHVQTGVAKILGLRADQVRVIQAATGGAFGPKSDEIPVDVLGMAALAAFKTRRPAVVAYTREESMMASTKRNRFIIRLKTGVKKSGRLTASEALLIEDTGAYASLGPLVIIRATFHVTGPYVIPHVKSDGYVVYTNNTMAGSMRGFGGPQAHFAAERQMDIVAERLGMDPLDFRLINILRPGTRTATNQLIDESCGLEECALRAAERAGWHRRRAELSELNRKGGPVKKGIGVALMYHGNSLGPEGNDYATVHMRIERDGTVSLWTGLTEYGTGAISGLVQIAAEVLGVPVGRFRLLRPDTKYALDTGPTVASRTIVIGGRAAQMAAAKLREKLMKAASSLLGAPEGDVEIIDGVVYHAGKPTGLSFEKLVEECYRQGLVLEERATYMAPICEFDPETSQGNTYNQYTFGALIAEVEVDVELGSVRVNRIVAAYDVGKAINPLMLEGQIEGGTIQSLGYAIMEEVIHEDGKVMNADLCNYYIPTSKDVPDIDIIIVEKAGPLGPWGAKAMGEPPAVLPAPAIANAVAHAIGVQVNEIPLTPERVLRALKGR